MVKINFARLFEELKTPAIRQSKELPKCTGGPNCAKCGISVELTATAPWQNWTCDLCGKAQLGAADPLYGCPTMRTCDWATCQDCHQSRCAEKLATYVASEHVPTEVEEPGRSIVEPQSSWIASVMYEVVDESDDDWELIPWRSTADLARRDDDVVELCQASAESGKLAPMDVDMEIQGASAGSEDFAATEKVKNEPADEAQKRFLQVLELLS